MFAIRFPDRRFAIFHHESSITNLGIAITLLGQLSGGKDPKEEIPGLLHILAGRHLHCRQGFVKYSETIIQIESIRFARDRRALSGKLVLERPMELM